MVIGFERAKNLMKQLDWKMLVTMNRHTMEISKIEVYHPLQPNTYAVRRDSGRKLMELCRVIGPKTEDTAILCYDHEGSNEALI